MIDFINLSNNEPYIKFKEYYDKAILKSQKNIEAAVISTYNTNEKEVESRYVNIKSVNIDNFIFFTNYNSPKSISILSHNQLSALFFWNEINVQIRIKAIASKLSKKNNHEYFLKRDLNKNALAISSRQSKIIDSYSLVEKKYKLAKINNNLKLCPDYWGGFQFRPYEIEFWEGHKNRINKRTIYTYNDKIWLKNFLEP